MQPQLSEPPLNSVAQTIQRIKTEATCLPLTMSLPLLKAIEEWEAEEYRNCMTRILDFFEMSVQWVNCYFLGFARESPITAQHNGVQCAVKIIDNKRPLSFGDIVNGIFNPLIDAMSKSVPDHPLVKSLSTHIKNRKTDIIVGSGKKRGVIKIRNDYKGHSISLAQQFYRDIILELLPKVEAMLAGLEPLANADIHTVTRNKEIVNLKGHWHNIGKLCPDDETEGHYYVSWPGLPKVDLFPLLVTRRDKYVMVFQTLREEMMKYESSDDNVVGFETDEYNHDLDLFLQKLLSSFDVAKEANWQELCEQMRAHSTAYMIQVQKEKKYNGDLFVDRKHLAKIFNDFLSSECSIMPLAGDAGQGKTNQMCYWAEMLLERNAPILIFSSASFADSNLESSLKTIFNISRRRSLERVLRHLHSTAENAGCNIVFLFDAINECLHYNTETQDSIHSENAPYRLFADIAATLVRPEYPRFKVITTCRSYTWKNEILPHLQLDSNLFFIKGDEENVQVSGFSDEETATAYQKYSVLYQMGTPYNTLDRRIVLRLRDPLIMKFTCSNYIGEALSVNTSDYISTALFKKMLDDIRNKSFAGHQQYELLMELARILLLSYLEGNPRNSIANKEVREALSDDTHPYHRLANLIYKKGGLSAAYTELRNKPDRPILREVVKMVDGEEVHSIEFIYERFQEYMMACAFLATDFGNENAESPELHYLKALANGSVNVVLVGTLRNALLMDREKFVGIMINLVALHRENKDVMQLVNEVFDTLISENYENELAGLLQAMMHRQPDDPKIITQFNTVANIISGNKATSDTINEYNTLSRMLRPIVNLRKSACVAVNNMLLSDFFNENLYGINVLEMLWTLVSDNIDDVSNEACKFSYYLSRRSYTTSRSPLRENLTKRIIHEMYSDIRSRTIVGNMRNTEVRIRSIKFLETATRLAVLLIIDATISEKQDRKMITEMLDEIRGIAGYFTWKYRLIHLAMPFLQSIMRRQLTFQSAYVNNIIEYQSFWNDAVVSMEAGDKEWSRPRLRDAMEFVRFFTRHHADLHSPVSQAEMERFREFIPVVISSYASGCSFTYFIMERIMIIMGCGSWELVREIFATLLAEDNRSFEWFDYMQMSLLYTLYHLQLNSPKHNSEILDIYTRQARDWTLRCRGLFKAHNSAVANPVGLYKRNVINWYCVVYCCHHGDNVAHSGDSRPVPLVYELIDKAVADNDKQLLFHLIDNISELISDYGYVHTALAALKYILTRFDSTESVERLDHAHCEDDRYAQVSLGQNIGSVLSTAKTYFPDVTDAFLRSDIIGLKFPGIENYTEQILNFHTGGESLSDLFTHKFGNFLLWGLLHEETVDDFAYDAVCSAINSKDCIAWIDKVIRLLFKEMFNVKI